MQGKVKRDMFKNLGDDDIFWLTGCKNTLSMKFREPQQDFFGKNGRKNTTVFINMFTSPFCHPSPQILSQTGNRPPLLTNQSQFFQYKK